MEFSPNLNAGIRRSYLEYMKTIGYGRSCRIRALLGVSATGIFRPLPSSSQSLQFTLLMICLTSDSFLKNWEKI